MNLGEEANFSKNLSINPILQKNNKNNIEDKKINQNQN